MSLAHVVSSMRDTGCVPCGTVQCSEPVRLLSTDGHERPGLQIPSSYESAFGYHESLHMIAAYRRRKDRQKEKKLPFCVQLFLFRFRKKCSF
jgi:hypothetical protein